MAALACSAATQPEVARHPLADQAADVLRPYWDL
jgi:hypothetical protein